MAAFLRLRDNLEKWCYVWPDAVKRIEPTEVDEPYALMSRLVFDGDVGWYSIEQPAFVAYALVKARECTDHNILTLRNGQVDE